VDLEPAERGDGGGGRAASQIAQVFVMTVFIVDRGPVPGVVIGVDVPLLFGF